METKLVLHSIFVRIKLVWNSINMSCYYSVMETCKGFYKSPLLVRNCLSKSSSHGIPSFPRARSGLHSFHSGTFRTAVPCLCLLEAYSWAGQNLSSPVPREGAWSHKGGGVTKQNWGVELPFPIWSHPIREYRSRDQRAVSPSPYADTTSLSPRGDVLLLFEK